MSCTKEMQVCSLTSRNRSRVDDRDIFYKRFCRGKTARLCVNDIAGIHKKGYMIGIPDNMDPFVKMKFFPQNAFDLCIISTDDHNVFSVPAAEC